VAQQIRFCSAPGGRVAYAAVGEGPLLVLGGWWVSHLELDWERADFRAFVEGLAASRTVVRYDPLGAGLSDRGDHGPLRLDDEVATLAAVLDAADASAAPAALLGVSSGSCVAAALAARQPERTQALVLYGGYRRGADVAAPEVRETMLNVVRTHWGVGSRVFADVFLPDASAGELREFARFQRAAAAAETAVEHLRFVYEVDVSAELAALRARTLVLHRRADRAIPFDLGRDLAASISDARLVALDGSQHLPWRGNAMAVVAAVRDFLGDPPAAAAPVGAADAVPGRTVEEVPPETGASAGAPLEEPGSGGVPGGAPGLSQRELEVLRLVAEGLSDAEIAERLVLSAHTVHRHVANIRAKLRQPSRAVAVAQAGRLGLI
jgi:pimeloyl-ACP methyl ester carboxylesterase/DNA-binding CsgD family transcriptional regulator